MSSLLLVTREGKLRKSKIDTSEILRPYCRLAQLRSGHVIVICHAPSA